MQTERAIMEIDYFSQVFLTKTVLPTFYSKIRTYCLCVECRGFARNTVPCQLFGSQSRYSYVGQQLARRSGRAGRWGFGDLSRFCENQCVTQCTQWRGKPQGHQDEAIENGLEPDVFAQTVVRALINDEEYIVVGGAKEKLGVLVSRLSPSLLYKMIRKTKVK